jgi:hypothetical protein
VPVTLGLLSLGLWQGPGKAGLRPEAEFALGSMNGILEPTLPWPLPALLCPSPSACELPWAM